jgi:beta-glucosidase
VLQAGRKPPLDIYFLGDSITEFWPELGREVWQAEFGKLHVVNCGVAGDTTQNILYRITHGELEHVSPRVEMRSRSR